MSEYIDQDITEKEEENSEENEEDYSDIYSIESLNKAWRTEVHSPTILPYREELIDGVKGEFPGFLKKLRVQQDLLEKNFRDDLYFTTTLYQMDIERIRYSVTRYLRTRLLKIENNLEHILNVDLSLKDYLSKRELNFALELDKIKINHLNSIVYSVEEEDFNNFEPTGQSFRDKNAKPQLYQFVFFRALKPVQIETAPGEFENIGLGEICVTQYANIKNRVELKDVELI